MLAKPEDLRLMNKHYLELQLFLETVDSTVRTEVIQYSFLKSVFMVLKKH